MLFAHPKNHICYGSPSGIKRNQTTFRPLSLRAALTKTKMKLSLWFWIVYPQMLGTWSISYILMFKGGHFRRGRKRKSQSFDTGELVAVVGATGQLWKDLPAMVAIHGSLVMSPLNITQPLGIWSIMATIRWCPIFPKWDIYQPLQSCYTCS